MTKTIQKLSSLIKKHKFDWVNPDITNTLFETPKEISTDFKLYHFDRYVSSEDAIKEMEKDGFRPANSWELLTWKNTKDLVIALGSVGRVDGVRRVPCLYRGVSGRRLRLSWWGSVWGSRCRFLAVRNSFKAPETSKIETLKLGHLKNHVQEKIDSILIQLEDLKKLLQ